MGVCMKKIINSCLLVFFVALVLISTATAQEKPLKIGKIFAKEEANQLYGKVVNYVLIKKDVLKAALARADKYVLFAVKNNQPVVLNQKRVPLIASSVTLAPREKAAVFSKEVVEELLNSSTDSVIRLEIRTGGVVTISNTTSTLEHATICPPSCL